MTRKKRKGEYTCTCTSYDFPHRMFGGSCTGIAWVQEYWEASYGQAGECTDCPHREYGSCDVVVQTEKPLVCRGLEELIRYEEIKV